MQVGSTLAVFAGALLLAFALTPAVRRLAFRWGAVDQPGERKIHTQPVPRLGGVAVLVSVTAVVLSALWLIPEIRPAIASGLGAARWTVLAAAALLIVAMGAVDDVRGLPARFKFLVEIAAAAAVVLVAGAPVAIDFSPFAFSIHLGLLEPFVGVLWIVALTNAVNMTDVVDGVAAGVSAIAAAALAAMSLMVGNLVATTVLLALSGALIGFLPHNFRDPKMFLGDTGSLGAGFILGAASLVGLQRDGNWLAVPALLALAIPLTEIALTMCRRSLRALTVERASLPRERFVLHAGNPGFFVADKRHIPHRLLELGLDKRSALTTLYAVGIGLGVLGYATVRWPAFGPFVGLMVAATVIFFAPRWLYHELRVLERGALLPVLENRFVRRRLVHVGYDALVVFTTFVMAQAIMFGPAEVLTKGGAPAQAVVTVAALAGFWMAGLYRASYRHAGVSEALRATRSVVLGMVLALGALMAIGEQPLLATWLIHLLLVLGGVMGARLSFRVLDHLYQQGRAGDRRALIFGAGRGGDLAMREIRSNPNIDYVPVGFVDDDVGKAGRRFHGLPVYSGDKLRGLMRRLSVDDIVISTKKMEPARYDRLVAECRSAGVRIISFDLNWAEAARERIELAVNEPGLAGGLHRDIDITELSSAPTLPVIREIGGD